MATYAIGDIQGCFNELKALLGHIKFKPDVDTLWFAGDLVNRGPESLKTLRFIHSLGDNSVIVLGNHDLHLLSCRYLERMNPTKKDTTTEILQAHDCDFLLDWLRNQKLAHHDANLGFMMVHAGIPPSWNTALTIKLAREVEAILSGPQFIELLDNMYGNEPKLWEDSLTGWPRLRFVINALTRLRFSSIDGGIDMKYKGPLGSQPDSLRPWFELNTRNESERIVFGHWSSLKLSLAEQESFAVYPIDTGAVWGGELSAIRLEDKEIFSVPSSVALPI